MLKLAGKGEETIFAVPGLEHPSMMVTLVKVTCHLTFLLWCGTEQTLA